MFCAKIDQNDSSKKNHFLGLILNFIETEVGGADNTYVLEQGCEDNIFAIYSQSFLQNIVGNKIKHSNLQLKETLSLGHLLGWN